MFRNIMQQLINFQHIELVEQVIAITLNQFFEQEDSDAIFDYLASSISETKLLEQSIGADRAAYRFCWQNNYFTLQLDVTSQSIWLEADDETSSEAMPRLLAKLSTV